MTAFVAIGRRYLPLGWSDLLRQLAIWFGFLFTYQLARGLADRNPAKAFENGLGVVSLEKHVHGLFELTLQRITINSHLLTTLTSWTYWLSQFTVLGLALLWVYLRRHEHFARFRNTILLANLIGLIGYVALPTAPPRMFPQLGFVDTIATFGINHGSGFVQLASNQFAAMPSLHSADALIVGVTLAFIVKRWVFKILWLLWPAWVWFSVMATANHFWLDVVAGVAVAALAVAILNWPRILRAVRA
ncbi:MAG: phosphatase PAP2 family protein [Actinobacteria bacterium]|nr:phosphatase PAP2 family protein [Actinomycetota bacterium]